MVTKLSALAAVFALAAPSFGFDPPQKPQAQREREVKVALALADAKPAPAKPKAAAKVGKFDWFGETTAAGKAACPCGKDCTCPPGTCPAGCAKEKAPMPHLATPVKAEVTYRTELRQECTIDRFGRQTCHWVEYRVPVETGK